MKPDQPALPHIIRLLAPQDEAITPPLQQQSWPDVKDQVIPEVQAIADPRAYPERSRPRSVSFRWQPLDSTQNHARYDLLLATTPTFSDAQKIAALPSAEAEIPFLLLDTRYFWKVVHYSAGELVGESPVWSFQTHAAPPRWIHVPGITNVRDMGGWPVGTHRRVRQGLLFRSAEFNTHISLPPAGERVLIDELRIRTDLDLRGTAEEESPAPALDNTRVDWELCPLYAYGDIFTSPGLDSIQRAFNILAEPARYPILIHCWAGADRTGTLAFLINGLLGVSLDDLIHDYELTSLSRAGLRLHTSTSFQDLLQGLRSFGPPDASIQQQVEAYLLSIGVTPAQIENMRGLLIENNA
jgi:protein-tyrosine phosphatase